MKPYGLPRVIELEQPDVGDIQRFGLKSSAGRIKSKEYKSYIRKSKKRNEIRRTWKKKERAKVRSMLFNEEKNNGRACEYDY